MFEPADLRINPTFTRFKSFDNEAGPEGIEADIELRDRFGDPTKAAGNIYFELFRYRPDGPDVRGPQVGEAAFYDLSTVEAQRRHWQNVIRTYRFRLPWRDLDPQASYVLSATYIPGDGDEGADGGNAGDSEGGGGERLFDRLVVTPDRGG